MKKYIRRMAIITIVSIICMIACAWIREKFLTILGIITVLLCGYIMCRAVQYAESEAYYMAELRQKMQEETSLKIQRELFWWEIVSREEMIKK